MGTAMEATRQFMYGKLHRVTVTEANLHYVGSITIDPALLRAAGIYPNTLVDVVNITQGTRIQTYAIEGREGQGDICLNGAAAHQFAVGDLAIIMAYEAAPVSQLPGRKSRAVLVDRTNRLEKVLEYVTPSLEDLGREENCRYAELYPADL